MNYFSDRFPQPKYTELPDELAAHIYGGTLPGLHRFSDVTLKRGIISPNYFDSKLLTAADLKGE